MSFSFFWQNLLIHEYMILNVLPYEDKYFYLKCKYILLELLTILLNFWGYQEVFSRGGKLKKKKF